MSRLKSQVIYNDLTGGLNNVNNIDTINSTTKRTESPDMVNVEIFKLGGIKSMDGNTQFGDKQNSQVIAGWEYTQNNNKYMIIGLANGQVKIYNNIKNKFDLIYTFPSESDRMSFCNMNNGVVITNGKDDLIFYEKGRHQILTGTVSTTANSTEIDGHLTEFETELHNGDRIEIDNKIYIIDEIISDTKLTVTVAPVDTNTDLNYYLSTISQCNAILVNEEDPTLETPIRGLAIQYYGGRLWVGTSNGVFYSQIGQYNKWDIHYDAGALYSIYNDTSEVKALGLYSDYMLIHKEFNTYLLTCTGDSSTIAVKPYSNISCDSQQSWIVSNTKYYVYSREYMDIYPLTQRTIFSDKFLGEPLTIKVRDAFRNIRDEDADKIFCVSYPKKRWMIFYMPMVDNLGSGYGLIYDFQNKAFLVRRVPQDVTCAFNYFNNVYIGTSDGYILKEFDGTSFNGDVINSYYKSPWLDWSNDYFQSFAEFVINLSDDYNNNFYIRTFKDGMDRYEDRIIDTGLTSGLALLWDGYGPEVTNYYVFRWQLGDGNYEEIARIPKLKASDTIDTYYTVDNGLYLRFYKEDYDLIIKTYNPSNSQEEDYITLEDYYLPENVDYNSQDMPDNTTVWDNDCWVSSGFNGIRMVLPNNVFEKFQIEFGTNSESQAFAIYGYQFRRVETEEAPW